MRKPRLLVFDLDGTLIDSTLDLCNSINAMLAHRGRSPLSQDVIASYIGDGATMLVRRALGDQGDHDASAQDETELSLAMQFFLDWYRAHKLDNTRCYAGVEAALAAMHSRHPELLMAVLTNKPVGPSRGICSELGIAPYFFQNYGGDSFPTKKPDPHGLLTMVREANAILATRGEAPLDPDEVAMIGDSDVDVMTGKRCGARTVGCMFGIAPHTLHAAAPDVLVHHASEWAAVLGFAV